MGLKEFLQIIRKRLHLIIYMTLGLALTASVVSYFLIKPSYRADTWVIIGSTSKGTGTDGQNYNDILMYQQMVKTYSKLAKSRIVAENVIGKLNLSSIKSLDLLEMITVTQDTDTQFLIITAISKDPEQAMNIANQFARSLKEVSLKVNKVDIVEIIDDAQIPLKPDSPKPILNTVIVSFVGFMLSIGISVLLEYIDSTIKTKEDVESLLGLPVIGTISLVDTEEVDVII